MGGACDEVDVSTKSNETPSKFEKTIIPTEPSQSKEEEDPFEEGACSAAPQEEVVEDDASSVNSDHIYNLMSIVCHLGQSASRGHYVSDVYNPKTDNWSCFDDETI